MNQHDLHKSSFFICPMALPGILLPPLPPESLGDRGSPCLASQARGWWQRVPSAPKHRLKEGVRQAKTHWLCWWERQRFCKLLSAPSLSICLWGPALGSIPELLPRGQEREVAGRGRSFPSGRAARDVALVLGLAQRELCCTRNVTENFICLWTSSTSILKENPDSLRPVGVVLLPSAWARFSLALLLLQNKFVPPLWVY